MAVESEKATPPNPQGQRTLSANPDRDLRQKLFAPSALPTPSKHAVLVRTLLEQ